MQHATVVKAPAGLGKTRAFAAKIANSIATPIEVYVPTQALADEWRTWILQVNPSKRVVIVRGRSYVSAATGKPMCQISHEAEKLSKAGFPVYHSVCMQSQGKGRAPLQCPHYRACAYINQFTYADVYIYTHAQLPLARGPLENWFPVTVVIDESFFQSCIDTIKFNISLLTHPNIPAKGKPWCAAATRYLTTGKSHSFGTGAGAASASLRGALRALADAPLPVAPGMPSSQIAAAISSRADFTPVRILLAHLDQELARGPTARSVDFDSANGEITVHHRKAISRFSNMELPAPKMFILDASASKTIIGQFFVIDDMHEHQVKRNAHVIQCHTTRCSTASLVPARNTSLKSRKAAERRLIELQTLIWNLCADGRKVLVVGPAAVTGNPSTGVPSLLAVPSNCALAHFNAIRGADCWKDYDTVLIIGRNEPTAKVAEDIARALFCDGGQPIARTGKWNVEPRGYRMPGQILGVDVNVHADWRVQAVVEQIRESESVQAIDRLRLIHCTEPKRVIVLSNIPLDIEVNETRTWDEIMHGNRLERAWLRLNGVMPLSPRWLSNRFPDLWRTEAAAKNDVLGVGKRSAFSNSIYIRKTRLFSFSYRHAGQKRASHCLSRSDDVAWVKTELEALTGQICKVTPRGPVT